MRMVLVRRLDVLHLANPPQYYRRHVLSIDHYGHHYRGDPVQKTKSIPPAGPWRVDHRRFDKQTENGLGSWEVDCGGKWSVLHLQADV